MVVLRCTVVLLQDATRCNPQHDTFASQHRATIMISITSKFPTCFLVIPCYTMVYHHVWCLNNVKLQELIYLLFTSPLCYWQRQSTVAGTERSSLMSHRSTRRGGRGSRMSKLGAGRIGQIQTFLAQAFTRVRGDDLWPSLVESNGL